MWENKFNEKIYSSMRYVDCYCNKHARVLVGMKLYPFVNTLALLGVVVLLALFLPSTIPLAVKVGMLVVLGLVSLLPISFYKDGKKMMLKAGHTEICGQKIGRLVALHGGTYSPYTIMKKGKGKNK